MRVLSGIQSTGTIHLGNYFGALVNWVKLQNEGHDCFYFIANQHSITIPQEAEKLKKTTLELAAVFLAVGLDPEKSTLFVQSDIPAQSQFLWVLNCLSPMGQMERMIQFKEKSQKNPDSVNLGLFSYPVLQAADVLLYKADLVPVGIDQAQHLELTRDLANKFNLRYKSIFPEPKTLHTQTTKVVGLDGTAKMSKSANNYIGLTEEDTVLWSKIAPAVTDPARVKKTDCGNPLICNVYALHKILSGKHDQDWVIEGCKNATIGCMDCKKRLFTNLKIMLDPIRDSYNSWINKKDELRDILADGAKKANKVAGKTLQEVYELIGFKY